MFKQLLIATTLAAALGYWSNVLAIDKIGVPAETYNSANSAPASEADSAPAATANDADSADAISRDAVSAPAVNEYPVESPNNPVATTDDAPIEPLHAQHDSTPAAHHANAPHPAHKNHANVRWQSLLPGVMK